MTDEFTGVGYVAAATMKAQEKEGIVSRTLELKVLLPEPIGDEAKKAFRVTARDVVGLVGERIVVHGATEQVRLPLDDQGSRTPA